MRGSRGSRRREVRKVDRALDDRTWDVRKTAQQRRGVDDLYGSPMPRLEAGERLGEAVRLIGVVDEDRSARKRRFEPMAHAKIGAHENERPTDGPVPEPGPDELDRVRAAKNGRRHEA